MDFADDSLTAAAWAGLEAALEASGLLDAWVGPDGAAVHVGSGDTLATAGAPVDGPSLAELLRPAVDRADPAASGLTDEIVVRLLAGIGLVGPDDPLPDSGTWLGPDGRFRLGALTGAWSKPAAEYLGEGAREQARRARIADVEAETAQVEERLAELAARGEILEAQLRTLAEEQDRLPDDSALRDGHAAVTAAQREYARAAQRREETGQAAEEAAAGAERAAGELHALAEELALPSGLGALRELRDAVMRLPREPRLAVVEAVREARSALAAVAAEEADHARAAEHAEELAERSRTAAREAVAAQERHETLTATVGAAVADLQQPARRGGRRTAGLRRGRARHPSET